MAGHTDEVTAVAAVQVQTTAGAPGSGPLIVSGAMDQSLRVWVKGEGDAKFTFTCAQTITGHTGPVRAVASIDGVLLVSGSEDGSVRLWKRGVADPGHPETPPDQFACHQILADHTDAVLSVAFDGQRIISGSRDRTVKVYQRGVDPLLPSYGQSSVFGLLQTLAGHSGWVNAVATDGVRVFSASDDKTVRIWQRGADPVGDPSKHTLVQTLAGHSGPVYGVATNGKMVVSGSLDRTVKLWLRGADPNRPKQYVCFQSLAGHTDAVLSVVTAGIRVISGSRDGTIKVWSRGADPIKPEQHSCLHTLPGHDAGVNAVAVLIDSKDSRVISASADTSLKAW